jgi:hypothetical protein
MFVIGFPLLLVALAIYNIIAFLMPGLGWGDALTRVRVYSGAEWTMSAGDMLVTLSVLLLLIEFLKAVRAGGKNLVDHGLSLLLFLGVTAEFVLVRQAGTAPFFVLTVICFVEFVVGFGARRRREPLPVTEEEAFEPPVEVRPAAVHRTEVRHVEVPQPDVKELTEAEAVKEETAKDQPVKDDVKQAPA